MSSPSSSTPTGSSVVGASRATYFSPRRLDWRMSATALSGSTVPSATRMMILACQPTRSTSITSPTVTSLTMTTERGTTASTSANSAVTVKELSSLTGEPGSGRS